MLKKFGMENAKIMGTSCTSTKLDKDDHGISVDQKLYRSMIGSLLYLTVNRPNIMFRACLCARFQSNLKEYYVLAVKKNLNT